MKLKSYIAECCVPLGRPGTLVRGKSGEKEEEIQWSSAPRLGDIGGGGEGMVFSQLTMGGHNFSTNHK